MVIITDNDKPMCDSIQTNTMVTVVLLSARTAFLNMRVTAALKILAPNSATVQHPSPAFAGSSCKPK